MVTTRADVGGLVRSRLGGASEVVDWLERRLGVTVTGLGIAILVIAGWVAGRLLQSRALLLMVYGLGLLLVASWVVGRRASAIDADRSELPRRVSEGQQVEVELRVRARRRLSAVVLEEALHDRLGARVRIPVPSLPKGEEVSHSYSFSPRLRGVYDVGPLIAEWNDPFGLTRRRVEVTKPAQIIVHPASELVHDRIVSREWEDPPIRPPVSKRWPTGFEFYGMRDYVSGDDPRRISWRASARTYDPLTDTTRYLVRESEQGITDRVNILLDNCADVHSAGQPSETFETGVRAVASLGVKHLEDGFSVNLDLNGERVAARLRGRRDRLAYLDILAGIQMGRESLARSLERLITDPNRNAHNVVITPDLSQEAAARLRLMIERGVTVLIALLLWEDTDPATLHRAGTLGCSVVEIAPNTPLDRVFQRVMGMARQ